MCDDVLSVVPPHAYDSSSGSDEENATPGIGRIPSCVVRTASSVLSLDPKDALVATVISGAVTQATTGMGGNIPCAELLQGVEVPPSRAPLVTSVNALNALRTQSFPSEAERKAAVLPILVAIREAILALPDALFKWKLMPLVERIDVFVQ